MMPLRWLVLCGLICHRVFKEPQLTQHPDSAARSRHDAEAGAEGALLTTTSAAWVRQLKCGAAASEDDCAVRLHFFDQV